MIPANVAGLRLLRFLTQFLARASLWLVFFPRAILCNSIPQEMKDIYKTVWEIKMKSIIDLAADRGAFVDQSQVCVKCSEQYDAHGPR